MLSSTTSHSFTIIYLSIGRRSDCIRVKVLYLSVAVILSQIFHLSFFRIIYLSMGTLHCLNVFEWKYCTCSCDIITNLPQPLIPLELSTCPWGEGLTVLEWENCTCSCDIITNLPQPLIPLELSTCPWGEGLTVLEWENCTCSCDIITNLPQPLIPLELSTCPRACGLTVLEWENRTCSCEIITNLPQPLQLPTCPWGEGLNVFEWENCTCSCDIIDSFPGSPYVVCTRPRGTAECVGRHVEESGAGSQPFKLPNGSWGSQCPKTNHTKLHLRTKKLNTVNAKTDQFIYKHR